jgi:hypothetical protein
MLIKYLKLWIDSIIMEKPSRNTNRDGDYNSLSDQQPGV